MAQNKLHVKQGEKVKVISGKDKGKEGVILKAMPAQERVIVEGVNIVKKHAKPSQENPQGGILNQEAAIHVSNVMPLDPKSGEPTRVGHKVENGKKVRVAKKSGETLN
ncbi:50S ribosomal protein L24 [Marinococcus halophilus]|uniref:Large ribosomal subunit protein uL24 n=1 Tax=Marinococcus halophilus TaxID=1371 RepID=A0A510Y991_MARHA|nr:50S ribosomal protein L24 [Marinococcus halophilus]OZT79279.1 50S ribosomal protein L24 [Marinococcus halophilus]GEK59733.1 50S ribosomal protein L24 [Marinococcus halophilus]